MWFELKARSLNRTINSLQDLEGRKGRCPHGRCISLAKGGMHKKMEERTGQLSGQELKGRSLLVLYGTETGHSKEIAEEIVEAAERLRFQTSVEQMNDVSLVSLSCQASVLGILTKFNNARKK